MKRGERLKRKTPLRRGDSELKRTPLRSKGKRPKAVRDGRRYGPIHDAIRALPCWAITAGYTGPGHPECGPGTRWLPKTGCHIPGAYLDEEGEIPGCGALHDLIDGIGTESDVRHFQSWLESHGLTLAGIAADYVNTTGGE